MAAFTLRRPDVFGDGTNVSVYPSQPWQSSPTSGAPPGSATDSGTVSSGAVTFTGLAPNTVYIAHAGSPDRYVRFSTAQGALDPSLIKVALVETVSGGYPQRPDSSLSAEWIGWNDPGDAAADADTWVEIPAP